MPQSNVTYSYVDINPSSPEPFRAGVLQHRTTISSLHCSVNVLLSLSLASRQHAMTNPEIQQQGGKRDHIFVHHQ